MSRSFVIAPDKPSTGMVDMGQALADHMIKATGKVDVEALYGLMIQEAEVATKNKAPWRLTLIEKYLVEELKSLEERLRLCKNLLKREHTERNMVIHAKGSGPHNRHHGLENIRATERELARLRAQINFLSRFRRKVWR